MALRFWKKEFALTISRKARVSAFALALLTVPGAAPILAQDGGATASAASAGDTAQWRQELSSWRAAREREVAAPDGWLTLVGLEWLKSGINSVGAAADNRIQLHGQVPAHVGLLTVSGKTVQLLSPSGGFPQDLLIDGKPAREGTLAAGVTNSSTIAWHGLTLMVLERGDRFALRIKDANSPTRTEFHGLNWYAPDPRFRVTAKWISFTPPHIEQIPTVIGTMLELPAPGVAEFTLEGTTLQLEPVTEASEPGILFFILRDTTSKTTTYQAARFLHTGLPDHGLSQPGLLTLDFNQLENPPCAYTPYATCPLPPDQNRLPVALEAGEQRYAH
jgi:uncharacterized protein (DUF1684 family)